MPAPDVRGCVQEAEWLRRYYEAVNPAWIDTMQALGLPTHFVRAKNLQLWTPQRHVVHDMVAGFGSAIFGHAPQDLVGVLRVAIGAELPNVLVYGAHPVAATVAGELLSLAPGSLEKVHFCNDGSQAIDSALKFAAIATQRCEFVSMKDGFHGLSVGATALAGGGPWRQGLPSIGPRVRRLDIRDWDAIERCLSKRRTAAIVIEVVQSSGVVPAWSRDALLRLQALCRETATLVIVDEVMTGLGRTGRWFAYEEGGREFEPDLVTLSKSLSAGLLPVAAVMMTTPIYEAVFLPPGHAKIHGSTFSGNRVGLMLAEAVMRRLRAEKACEHVSRVGRLLERRLNDLANNDLIGAPVGRGLLQAFEVVSHGRRMSRAESALRCLSGLLARGWLTLPAGHSKGHLRIMPPYTIQAEQVIGFVDALEDTVRDPATWR